MDQHTLLSDLVREEYGPPGAELHAIPLYLSAKRAVERIELADGRRWVLRAFWGDAAEIARELRGQVAVLAYLAQRGYRAPHVVPTHSGEMVASRAGWTALVIGWIEGTQADFEPDALARLGAAAGALHALPLATSTAEGEADLPDCRLRPPTTLPEFALAAHLPEALRTTYNGWVAALRCMVDAAPRLPLALLHGDCWPGNAVVAENGSLALVDWDGAGLGPAVLDVGYLLLTCHLSQSNPFALQPDPAAIGAVARGYCRSRHLTIDEVSVLEDAVRYDLARRAVLDGGLFDRLERWETDTQVRKWLARDAIVGEIAALARVALGCEVSTK